MFRQKENRAFFFPSLTGRLLIAIAILLHSNKNFFVSFFERIDISCCPKGDFLLDYRATAPFCLVAQSATSQPIAYYGIGGKHAVRVMGSGAPRGRGRAPSGELSSLASAGPVRLI